MALTSRVTASGTRALLMNRLMFIYFMQRKGFLDNDRDYLRTRLSTPPQPERRRTVSTSSIGNSCCPCSTMVSALPAYMSTTSSSRISSATSPTLTAGSSPSTNSKQPHPDIRIPDDTFESIFDLFDSYQWHLDDRPTAQSEINPDVLGYIFEQFINQKEQGAYYTKDDVTHFMTVFHSAARLP